MLKTAKEGLIQDKSEKIWASHEGIEYCDKEFARFSIFLHSRYTTLIK
jgi:hypothetical protein